MTRLNAKTQGSRRLPSSILMTTHPLGGVWSYSLELARGLSAAGVEVSLAVMGAPLNADQRSELRALRTVDLHESVYRLEWMNEPWQDVERAGEWLMALEDIVNPDIVHLNGYAHAALPWHSKVMVVAHGCRQARQAAIGEPLAEPARKRYETAVRCGLKGADVVVAPTRAMLHHLMERYELAGGRVIRNGRDPASFLPGEKESVIVSHGALRDPAKNLKVLERIAGRLAWPILVIGDARGAAPPGQPGSTPLGRLPPRLVGPWLSRTAIFASPALYEPFGLPILDAALAGCALVLADTPAMRELWDGAAWFVAPSNSDGFAAALGTLVLDRQRRASLGDAARGRALRYSARAMTDAYLATYSDLMAAQPRDQFAETKPLIA